MRYFLIISVILLTACSDTGQSREKLRAEIKEELRAEILAELDFPPPSVHWALQSIDAITPEHVMRAGGLLCTSLGVLCAVALVFCVLFMQIRLARIFGFGAPLLFVTGATLAFLGPQMWWVGLVLGVAAMILGGAWAWYYGIPELERMSGGDLNGNGVVGA